VTVNEAAPIADDGEVATTPGISISIAWAISQYRNVVRTVANAAKGVGGIVKLPKEPPEVLHYLRSIGIGRNVDVYA